MLQTGSLFETMLPLVFVNFLVLLTLIICGYAWHVLVQSLPCSLQSSLEYLNPKYNHSILRLFQFSSFPFNFTFISCLYTGSVFFSVSQKPLSTSLSLSLLSLPLWVPSASLALSFHCNFILNSSHLALLRVCVYYSFFPSYPLNHHHHWFLAPSTTSTAIIGQGLKYASMCVLQNKTIFMTKH